MLNDDELREEVARRYPASWEDRGRTDRDDERYAFLEGYEAGVAAERERCARIAIDMATESHWNTGPSNAAHLIAAAIRADDREQADRG